MAMPTKVYETRIRASVQSVWDFLASPLSLRLLTPPDQEMEIVSKDNQLREGVVQEFKTKQLGIWITWKIRVTKVTAPHAYTYSGIKTPFKEFTHHVDLIDDCGESILRETVHYELKGGAIGNLVNAVSSDERLDKYFKFRQRTLRNHMETSKAAINTELFERETEYVSDFALDEQQPAG